MNCPIKECRAANSKMPCGYWPYKLECRHPRWRERWLVAVRELIKKVSNG